MYRLIQKAQNPAERALRSASVAVIGAGALGAPVLTYLAAAGVSHITIIDGKTVEAKSLGRQVLYGGADVGRDKASAAAKMLLRMNEALSVRPIVNPLTDANAEALLRMHDAAVLCVDSVATRQIANRALVSLGIPFIDCGSAGNCGVISTIEPGVSPCYCCLYGANIQQGEADPSPGAVCGMVGSLAALATIRLLGGKPDPSQNGILHIDTLSMRITKLSVSRDPNCPVCGEAAKKALRG